MKKVLFGAAGVFLSIAVPAQADETVSYNIQGPHMTVKGEASVLVKPDIAYLSLGVVTEDPVAFKAQQDNATALATVVADLKNLGLDPVDIKTENVSLNPQIVVEYDPKTHEVVKRTLTGYHADAFLRVTIHDVDKAGAIVSHVVEKGANTYRGIHFAVTDADQRLDDLRAKAVADGARRAALYADGAKLRLGKLLILNPDPRNEVVGEADLPRRPLSGIQTSQTIALPVSPGLEELSVYVMETWELVQP